MKIIFIAGPYTGNGTIKDIDKNIEKAEKFQIALANNEIGFFCPHVHTSHFSTKKGAMPPEQFYYDLDFQFLMRIADAVLAMPGWKKSKGAKKEIAWAKKNGLKIFYPKDPFDVKKIVSWAKK